MVGARTARVRRVATVRVRSCAVRAVCRAVVGVIGVRRSADARVAVVRRFYTISKWLGRVLLLVGAVFLRGAVAAFQKKPRSFHTYLFHELHSADIVPSPAE